MDGPIFNNIQLSVEDDDIHTQFAKVLRGFRLQFGTFDLGSVASEFKIITHKKLLNTYQTDSSNIDVISNWILECKFWTLLEALNSVKFNKELLETNQSITSETNLDDICEYSSDIFITDKLIMSDAHVSQLQVAISTLSQTFGLDFPSSEDDEFDMQMTKWLNTLNNLNSMSQNPNLVESLDADAPTRTGLQINPIDQEKDEVFFKKAFHLLISNEMDDLKELCKITNNFDFSLILAGFEDRIDPIMDLNDFSRNTIPTGVKSKILRKRTLYQLLKTLEESNTAGKYEKACYGFLANDFVSSHNLANNWEEKLFLYLKNYVNNKLDDKIMRIHEEFNIESVDFSLVSKLPKPPIMANSVDDILNKLSNDTNQMIKEQSKHSIRVLIGSVISDNVKSLMNNTIQSLEDMIDQDGKDNVLADTYLLRILTHFAIILQLVYGESLIKNENYTQLLNFYIHRLTLYKSYELIPTYVAYIPEETDMIKIYSELIMKFEFTEDDRNKQISGIRFLQLPLESILRETIERAFDETAQYYPTNKEVELSHEVMQMDKNLYNIIFWFIDAQMIDDAIEATTILLRRFLLVGKIGSSYEFLSSIDLPTLISNYQLKYEINEEFKDMKLIMELIQYKNFFNVFKKLEKFDIQECTYEEFVDLVEDLKKLIKSWLFDLTNDAENSENKETLNELRRVYIPTLFNTLFDMLVGNKFDDKELIKEAIDLVNLLADEDYKLYEIFASTDELNPFMVKFADVSCQLYSKYDEGVYI